MRPPGGMDPSKMKEDLFAKVDADGSGAVDKTELQGMLQAVAGTGTTSNTADVFSTMDADGNGSLTADELDSGMKSLMPPPADTVAFAQSRSGSEPPQGPPPPGGPPPGASASASDSTDPLDTNGDGTVSAQEKAAGELATAMSQLFDAVDSDGDSTISSSERDTFLQMLSTAAEQATPAAGNSADGASCESGDSSQRGSFDVAEFANMVLRQYTQTSAASDAEGVGSTLSVAA
jgi:hypothetical protein